MQICIYKNVFIISLFTNIILATSLFKTSYAWLIYYIDIYEPKTACKMLNTVDLYDIQDLITHQPSLLGNDWYCMCGYSLHLTCNGVLSAEIVVNPTMSEKNMVTWSKLSASIVSPFLRLSATALQ